MDSNQRAKAYNSEVSAGRISVINAIEHYINAGEYAISAKELEDDYTDWVERVCGTTIIQTSKYIRIAKHKTQARQLVADGLAGSVNGLQKLLPKSSEAPELTEADVDTLSYVGRKPNSRDSNDWHTPSHLIDRARDVMGSIDLDPFSSVQANQSVKAGRLFTEADDAFSIQWADPNTKTVWMNPPYSKGASSAAVDKFLEEYDYGSFDQAVVLMNASTDTNWFHRLAKVANAVCFTKGRIAFEDAGGKQSSGNTKGQTFFYFGRNVKGFKALFDDVGWVLDTRLVS